MVDLIQKHRAELTALCLKYRVKTLELFGSAADGSFDPARSDLDFLVEFNSLGPGQPFLYYFGLWEDLRNLFGRNVDLLTPRCLKNRFLREAVDRQRQVLYAA